jgi:outer membrane biosynthesis protein TonB
MRPIALVMFAGLIVSPASAAEDEQPAAVPAPAAAEAAAPAPVADPAPAPAVAQQPSAASEAAPTTAESTAAKPQTERARNSIAAPRPKDGERKKPETAQKPALTKQAYVRLLASEIRRRTPKTSQDKIGTINVAFTIGPSGRVVSHKVQDTSNPALEPIVGRILASIQTPPPPGGSFSAVQQFNFH